MKYVIVESGGKQYKAVEGSTIDVDLLHQEVGETVTLDKVLLYVNDDVIEVGTPAVKGASVKATIASQEKGPKIIVFKYKPKKHYRVKTGHRQKFTRLVVEKIETE